MRLFITDTQDHAFKLSQALHDSPIEKNGYYDCHNDIITWCNGPLFQLAEPETYQQSWKTWDITDLPIVPPQWQWQPRKEAFVQLFCLKKLIREADEIVHAGGEDKESQLTIDILLYQANVISDPVLPILQPRDNNLVKRLHLNDLSIKGITQQLLAMQDNSQCRPTTQAALCRHVTDWLYGINMSRLLTTLSRHEGKKIIHSAGRVQTPILELVRDRESDNDTIPYTEQTLSTAMQNIKLHVKDPLVKKTLKSSDGLGNEHTRLQLIHHLYKKEYLKRNGNDIHITDIGRDFLALFPKNHSHIDMTAIWEAKLSTIESRTDSAQHFIDEFTDDLGKLMSATLYHFNCRQNKKTNEPHAHTFTPLQLKPDCPECGTKMLLKLSNYGVFWSCTNYPSCRGKRTFNNDFSSSATEPETTQTKTKLSEILSEQPPCPKCHAPLVKRKGKYGVFWGCSQFPRCRCHMKDINGTPDLKTYYFGKKI